MCDFYCSYYSLLFTSYLHQIIRNPYPHPLPSHIVPLSSCLPYKKKQEQRQQQQQGDHHSPLQVPKRVCGCEREREREREEREEREKARRGRKGRREER